MIERNAWRICLAIGACLFLLFVGWLALANVGYLFGLELKGPFESKADFHIRMMRFHDDGADPMRYTHAKAIVADGARSMPALLRALRKDGVWVRYDPDPVEMINRIGVQAKPFLLEELKSLDGKESLDLDSIQYRNDLIYTIIRLTDDWSYLDQWLIDAPFLPADELSTSQKMQGLVYAKFADENPPPVVFNDFNVPRHQGPAVFNQEFTNWWGRNKSRLKQPL